jgi:hypothetical protein
MNILPLAQVDVAAGIAKTAVRATYPLCVPVIPPFLRGSSLWVENALTFLDEPGEWVLDSDAGKVYLWPLGDEPGDNILAPALTEIVRVEGDMDYDGPQDSPVRGLVFKGLTFTQAGRFPWEKDRTGWGLQHDWEMFDRPTAMLRFRGAEDCAVEGCRFVNSGASAVRLDLHACRNRVERCSIHHVGGAGVVLAGYALPRGRRPRGSASSPSTSVASGRAAPNRGRPWARPLRPARAAAGSRAPTGGRRRRRRR